ncbi:MAG: hypothetical protein ABIR11_13935 [Candidatus Limnocylindrales bacterium]
MRWQPTRSRRGPLASLMVTPARATVGIGALISIVAGVMPWAQGTVPGRAGFEPVFFSGLGGAGDGVVLILLALGTAFVTLHHTPASSRVRLLHALPYVLIALAAITCLNGYRAALVEIAAWERRGGTGQVAAGLYLAGLGVLTMAAGAIALLPALIHWETVHDDPADLMTVSRRGLAEVILGTIGVLPGGALGIQAAIWLTPVPVIGLIALAAVFGGLLGAYAGSWLAGRLADELARRRTSPGA